MDAKVNVNCSSYHMHETQRFSSETYTIDMKHEPKVPKPFTLVKQAKLKQTNRT